MVVRLVERGFLRNWSGIKLVRNTEKRLNMDLFRKQLRSARTGSYQSAKISHGLCFQQACKICGNTDFRKKVMIGMRDMDRL